MLLTKETLAATQHQRQLVQGLPAAGSHAVRARRRTRENFESQYAINYLAHVHLTQLLLEGMLEQVCTVPAGCFQA